MLKVLPWKPEGWVVCPYINPNNITCVAVTGTTREQGREPFEYWVEINLLGKGTVRTLASESTKEKNQAIALLEQTVRCLSPETNDAEGIDSSAPVE
jgi:hypothetical protein